MDHLRFSSILRWILFSKNYSKQLCFVTDFYPESSHPVASLWVLLRKAKATMWWLSGGFFTWIGPGGFLEHLLGCQVRWVFVHGCLQLEPLLWSTPIGQGLVWSLFYPILKGDHQIIIHYGRISIDQPISCRMIPINQEIQEVYHGMMAFGAAAAHLSSRHQWLQLGATAGCCTCPVSIQAGGLHNKIDSKSMKVLLKWVPPYEWTAASLWSLILGSCYTAYVLETSIQCKDR